MRHKHFSRTTENVPGEDVPHKVSAIVTYSPDDKAKQAELENLYQKLREVLDGNRIDDIFSVISMVFCEGCLQLDLDIEDVLGGIRSQYNRLKTGRTVS